MSDPAPRRYLAGILAVVLTCDLGVLIGGSHPWSGPEIMRLSYHHGIHVTDLFATALWAVALGWCWWWSTTDRRGAPAGH